MQTLDYLLPSDVKRKKELELYIEENRYKKIPSKEQWGTYNFSLYISDLEKDLECWGITEEQYIHNFLNKDSLLRYCIPNYEFVGIFGENKRYIAPMFLAHKEFIDALDEIEFYQEAVSEMYQYFKKKIKNIDYRNLYEKEDGVYLGYRPAPTPVEWYDPRMLGVLNEGHMIMTTKEYHTQLRKIKNNLKKKK